MHVFAFVLDIRALSWLILVEVITDVDFADEISVTLNGTPLDTPRGSSDDPVDPLLRLADELGCGDTVTLDYVRDDARDQVSYTIPESDRP